jgi:hypothetical protein
MAIGAALGGTKFGALAEAGNGSRREHGLASRCRQ